MSCQMLLEWDNDQYRARRGANKNTSRLPKSRARTLFVFLSTTCGFEGLVGGRPGAPHPHEQVPFAVIRSVRSQIYEKPGRQQMTSPQLYRRLKSQRRAGAGWRDRSCTQSIDQKASQPTMLSPRTRAGRRSTRNLQLGGKHGAGVQDEGKDIHCCWMCSCVKWER